MGGQNPDREILLSISIMVSGREETTKQCIASLDRLRERVPCELILTDTGCGTELRSWLESKADMLLDFSWCDDFSAARNVGLQASGGQWFLFMDDDEWFEDTSQIEDFFLSGEYRRYETAFYRVRNYANIEGTAWTDIFLARMARRRQGIRFRYAIHEILFPLAEPVKRLEDYVHHYGYVNDDSVLRAQKRERNLSLLLPAIEADPGCMHHRLQAVGEYAAANDWTSALEMAEEGIRSFETGREDNGNYIQGLYAAAVQMRIQAAMEERDTGGAAKHYADAIRRGQELLESGSLTRLAIAHIAGSLTIACGMLHKDAECENYTQIYLDMKAYYEKNPQEWVRQSTLILNNCFELRCYSRAVAWGVNACLILEQAEALEKLLAREDIEWWLDTLSVWYGEIWEEHREKWGSALEREAEREKYSRAGQLYDTLMKRGQELETVSENEQAESRRQAVTPEMETLAAQLKEKIRLLIELGNIREAWNTIVQLQNFFPADAELERWRRELEAQ